MTNGGKRLREILARERFTLTEVAEAIGVSRRAIYTWSDTAPIDKLFAIAKFINVPFAEIADCYNPDRSAPTSDPIEDN
jgi:transcriptional regulator with XRE-family HTH domain